MGGGEIQWLSNNNNMSQLGHTRLEKWFKSITAKSRKYYKQINILSVLGGDCFYT